MNEIKFDKVLFLEQAVEVLPKELANIQCCLVLAPHPDDESLGCGGLIAMLASKNVEVTVIVTTDGSQSRPNSKNFPPEKVKLFREKDVIKALEILGVEKNKGTFFEQKDASLPTINQPGFDFLVHRLSGIIKQVKPQLILVPYELDPHYDHRVTWQILHEALNLFGHVKVWEYPIWLYELAEEQDIPQLKHGALKKINIEAFLNFKERAIQSHISQTRGMIDDDPTGFILKSKVLTHFTTDYEYYFERERS